MLPKGTLTLLFTDIERSTELAQRLGSRFADMIQTHNRLLRGALKDGVEIGTEGDSFFVAFESAGDAVAAAVAAQRALMAHAWPDGAEVRVRMGLHTGRPDVVADGYVGLDVHRAARIAAAAHGGQVLISDATRALVARDLPAGVTVRDLGEHRLKGLGAAERVYQLLVPDFPTEFPALRSLDARPSNLPTPATSFIGRTEQVADAGRMLESARLVTFTGPGGTGKTRLALEVGALQLDTFADGVFLVALAPIVDPNLIGPTIAHVLGVRDEPDQGIGEAIRVYLADKRLLLILDNFEQVLDAAPFVAQVLQGAPHVRAIVTSRAPLRIAGEQEYPVPPLTVAGAAEDGPAGQVPEAVALFVERARAVDPAFQLTAANRADVTAICSRLDGLPLAIELAAARIRLLGPEQILQRLDRRLDLLAGGARDVPARQRTLRGAIDWSYGLLSAPEQGLFARASVFVGGWTLDAMEAVCGDSGTDVLETLGSLIEQSLVQRVPGDDGRYAMLETIREYARERLDDRGEAETVAARHAEFYVALAERAAPELDRALQRSRWLDRLTFELDNLRAAIRWAVERGAAEAGLRIATALAWFWVWRDRISEGRQVLATVLAPADPAVPDRLRARALNAAAKLATWQGDFAPAKTLIDEGLHIYRAIDDQPGAAEALNTLGWAAAFADPRTSLVAFDDSVEIFRRLGDDRAVAESLGGGGRVAIRMGDLAGARRRLEESVAALRRLGERHAFPLLLADLARLEQLEGDFDTARAHYGEAIMTARDAGVTLGLFWSLDLFAHLLIADGRAEEGLVIAAGVARRREEIGGGPALALIGLGEHREAARDLLDATTIERAWDAGGRMTLDSVVDYAVSRATRAR